MEDQELLAAIGKVVVDAASLEYAVAILVAAIEGHRDQACEDRAVTIVKKSGAAMRWLKAMTCAQLRGRGESPQKIALMLTTSETDVREALKRWDREHPGISPATKCDLIYRWHDVKAVMDDRHVIAHSLAMESVEADGLAGLVIFHPSTGKETQLTTSAVLGHVQDIRITYRRLHDAIVAQIAPPGDSQ